MYRSAKARQGKILIIRIVIKNFLKEKIYVQQQLETNSSQITCNLNKAFLKKVYLKKHIRQRNNSKTTRFSPWRGHKSSPAK